MVNINIEKFYEKFRQEYNFLYEVHVSGGEVAGEREAVEAFNDFATNNRDFISEFVKFRGDFISSDREAAAFMFAMEEYL